MDKAFKDDEHKLLEAVITHLTKRGHPDKTKRIYKKAIEHFFKWLHLKRKRCSVILKKFVDAFITNHLPMCDCPPPVVKDIKTVRAALNHLLLMSNDKQRNNQKPARPDIANEISIYSDYLHDICGLSEITCHDRIRNVQNFLIKIFRNRHFQIDRLERVNFHSYISNNTPNLAPGTKKAIAGSLRSYIKYLQFNGLINSGFENAVPTIPVWKLKELSPILSDQQLEKFLESFDHTSAVGIRDYAIARCMTDLALRAGEVAKIELKDIDWRDLKINIRNTKSSYDRILPLPYQLTKAIIKYLKEGRVLTKETKLFVRHTVPIGIALHTEQVRGAMRRAYARAGFSPKITGTHILRHTAATKMHRKGIAIKQVADILGHHSINTSARYTRINLTQLKNVILPWPEVR